MKLVAIRQFTPCFDTQRFLGGRYVEVGVSKFAGNQAYEENKNLALSSFTLTSAYRPWLQTGSWNYLSFSVTACLSDIQGFYAVNIVSKP
jgi:hypothetical protein